MSCVPPIAGREAKVMGKVSFTRWMAGLAAAAIVAVAQPSVAQAIGPDAAACSGRAAALLVRVHGLKDREGLIRVSTYPAKANDWLVKGRYIRRIDVAVPANGEANVCVALPAAGRYGVAVLHDRNGDHHANIFKDGGGFSNNPKLGWSKPDVADVAFAAGTGLTTLDIKLKYL